MDLKKICEAMIAEGIFKKDDSEADMLTAIAAAASDMRWARERKQEAKARIMEACKPREGDITLGDKD